MAGSPQKRARREAAGNGAGAPTPAAPSAPAALPMFVPMPIGVAHAPRAASSPRAPASPPPTAPASPPQAAAPPLPSAVSTPTPAASSPPPVSYDTNSPPAPQQGPAFAPPAAPPPAPDAFAPPPGGGYAVPMDATNANNWRGVQNQRDEYAWKHWRDIPQGEASLLMAWLNVVVSRGIPAYACTIMLRRVEPGPPYDILIPGEAVLGRMADGTARPDRALYEYIGRQRQQAQIAERFDGRITACTTSGGVQDLGGGSIFLAPAPLATASPAWGSPAPAAAGQPGWGQPPPYGMPPYGMPPYGMPPYGMPPYGAPPFGFGMPSPFAPSPYFSPQAPPPAAASDPALFKVWMEAQQAQAAAAAAAGNAQNQFQLHMMERVFQAMGQNKPNGTGDPFEQAGKVVKFARDLMDLNPKDEKDDRPGLHVHRVDGTTIVEGKDGEVNENLTLGFAIKDGIKEVISTVRGAKTQSALTNGAHAPGKTNGVKPS
jgi:hypothetical protein